MASSSRALDLGTRAVGAPLPRRRGHRAEPRGGRPRVAAGACARGAPLSSSARAHRPCVLPTHPGARALQLFGLVARTAGGRRGGPQGPRGGVGTNAARSDASRRVSDATIHNTWAAQAARPFDASSVEWPWLASRSTRRRGGPARDSPLRRRSPATPLPADARQLCTRATALHPRRRCVESIAVRWLLSRRPTHGGGRGPAVRADAPATTPAAGQQSFAAAVARSAGFAAAQRAAAGAAAAAPRRRPLRSQPLGSVRMQADALRN